MSLLQRIQRYLRERDIERVREARARGELVTDAILPGERGNPADRILMAEMGEL